MLFLNSKEIKVYKLDRKNPKELKEEGDSLVFNLIEEINIFEISNLVTKKNMKNIVTIQFNSKKIRAVINYNRFNHGCRYKKFY